MILEVDPADPTPVYEQIRSQVTTMVAAGTLPPGARLPTIRQLALDLGLAKGTVAKAYEQLLREGVVESGGRRGTVVAERATVPDVDLRRELERAAHAYAVRALQVGAGLDDAAAALRRVMGELERPAAGSFARLDVRGGRAVPVEDSTDR